MQPTLKLNSSSKPKTSDWFDIIKKPTENVQSENSFRITDIVKPNGETKNGFVDSWSINDDEINLDDI